MATCEDLDEEVCTNGGTCVEDDARLSCDCSSSDYFASSEFLLSRISSTSVALRVVPCNPHKLREWLESSFICTSKCPVTNTTWTTYVPCCQKSLLKAGKSLY